MLKEGDRVMVLGDGVVGKVVCADGGNYYVDWHGCNGGGVFSKHELAQLPYPNTNPHG